MRTYAIANFKGGTGKTVTACNLAALLARTGQRVLLIDADAQHNSSDFFAPDWDGCTLTDVLEGNNEPFWPDNICPSGRENLDLLCADMGLLSLDLAAIMHGSSDSRRRFADFLDAVKQDDVYDFVLIDCPPSFTAASVAALCCADEVIMPTRLDAFSRRGVLELIGQVLSIRPSLPSSFFRVLITMAGARDRLTREAEALIRTSPNYAVYDTVIHAGVAVGESSYARLPLYEYAPKSAPAKDYERLLLEVLAEASMRIPQSPPQAAATAPFRQGGQSGEGAI